MVLTGEDLRDFLEKWLDDYLEGRTTKEQMDSIMSNYLIECLAQRIHDLSNCLEQRK